MTPETNSRSVSIVLAEIVDNLQDIIRSEVRLARRELGQEFRKAKGAGFFLGIGAICGIFAAFFVLFAIMLALSIVIPIWAAALVVAAVTGLVAAIFTSSGRKRLRSVNPILEHTTENIKETFRWTKQHAK